MRCFMIVIIIAVGMATLNPFHARADTFVLQSGKKVEGTVKRVQNDKVTIRTRTGISTYNLDDFDDRTVERLLTNVVAQSLQQDVKTESSTGPTFPESSAERASPSQSTSLTEFLLTTGLLDLVFNGVGMLIAVVGMIWMIIAAFRASVFWGILLFMFSGMLFYGIPSAFAKSLVLGLASLSFCIPELGFLICHWKRAQKPFFVQVFGFCLVLTGQLLQGKWTL